jgi:hypothetical protein
MEDPDIEVDAEEKEEEEEEEEDGDEGDASRAVAMRKSSVGYIGTKSNARKRKWRLAKYAKLR